ncbi:SCAN domain-containing protein 3 [Eumeta japonica]|uniref:SCAN domain-containing protein 3 n=1 Tax=Eumeta variegata TaxID=151549 RepID=A0A4C1UEG9_EUMVA|nr:SCAN domain-containing protein 3 [Eumeta japonica]
MIGFHQRWTALKNRQFGRELTFPTSRPRCPGAPGRYRLVHWFLTWGVITPAGHALSCARLTVTGRGSGGVGGVEHGFVMTSGGGWTGDDARYQQEFLTWLLLHLAKSALIEAFLQWGFTSIVDKNVEKPQCVLCNKVLNPESMKPSKLKEHFAKIHKEFADKNIDFFKKKEGEDSEVFAHGFYRQYTESK